MEKSPEESQADRHPHSCLLQLNREARGHILQSVLFWTLHSHDPSWSCVCTYTFGAFNVMWHPEVTEGLSETAGDGFLQVGIRSCLN